MLDQLLTVLLLFLLPTCRQLLGLLQPAFMQLRQSLLSQLDSAIALLQQRPDTLEPFTAWLQAAAAHFLPGVAAAVASSKPHEQQQGEHRAGQAGTWHLSL